MYIVDVMELEYPPTVRMEQSINTIMSPLSHYDLHFHVNRTHRRHLDTPPGALAPLLVFHVQPVKHE